MKSMYSFDKSYRNKEPGRTLCGIRRTLRKSRQLLLRAVCVCCLACLAVTAYSSAKGAANHVRELLESITDILEGRVDPTVEGQSGKAEAIKNLIEANFDQVEMARGALGETWDDLTNQERDEFLTLFKALFLESYTKLVLNFLKREQLEITGESDVDGRKVVLTRIRRRDDVIPVSYYLQKEDERRLIVEVDIDGVGIVHNYNRAFGKVIRKTSFADLIEKMRSQERALKKSSTSE